MVLENKLCLTDLHSLNCIFLAIPLRFPNNEESKCV